MAKADKKGKCICKDCPSYEEGKEDIGYCLTGKSKVILEENGCICMNCPVQDEHGFCDVYYCTRGKAKVCK